LLGSLAHLVGEFVPGKINRSSPPEASRQQIGQLGERRAVRFLKEKGYRILERNFSCPRGEIDIIAFRNGVVAFVEVRCRTRPIGLDPLRTVTRRKQKRVISAARRYAALRELHAEPVELRFDIIAIRRQPDGSMEEIEHVENAFRTDA
jgi:putative endonuclease